MFCRRMRANRNQVTGRRPRKEHLQRKMGMKWVTNMQSFRLHYSRFSLFNWIVAWNRVVGSVLAVHRLLLRRQQSLDHLHQRRSTRSSTPARRWWRAGDRAHRDSTSQKTGSYRNYLCSKVGPFTPYVLNFVLRQSELAPDVSLGETVMDNSIEGRLWIHTTV